MSRKIAVGIDIGTYQVKVVITEESESEARALPKVIGVGFAESKGMRHGYIVNPADVSRALSVAVAEAEKTANVKVRRAYIAVGGIGLSGVTSSGSIVISRADLEITEDDLKNVLTVAEGDMPQAQSLNRKVLHAIPLQYRLDGKPVLGRPLGLKGNKLDVKVLFITCLEHHLSDLVATIEEAGIEVLDVMAAPLAASLVTVSKTQKIAGCVLANIGSETVSIVVYENSLPISLEVFPIGGTDITNDIALGLKIPLEDAESVKTRQTNDTSVPRRKLEEIIAARLSDIFDLIEAHLKRIGKAGLLPAGIIITGGGSSLETIEDLAKAALKLPSRIATMKVYGGDRITEVKDASWSVAYGLCLWGMSNSDESVPPPARSLGVAKAIGGFFKQFLP